MPLPCCHCCYSSCSSCLYCCYQRTYHRQLAPRLTHPHSGRECHRQQVLGHSVHWNMKTGLQGRQLKSSHICNHQPNSSQMDRSKQSGHLLLYTRGCSRCYPNTNLLYLWNKSDTTCTWVSKKCCFPLRNEISGKPISHMSWGLGPSMRGVMLTRFEGLFSSSCCHHVTWPYRSSSHIRRH